MDASVRWQGELSFDGTADSGFHVLMGGGSPPGGRGDGLRPMELLLVGLAGCTAMDVLSILEKKNQRVMAFEVRAHAERAAEHPKVFTSIHLTYVLTGAGIDRDAVERAIELSETRYCPAQAMLVKAAPVTHSYEIQEVSPSP